jgi:hypothetical protein
MSKRSSSAMFDGCGVNFASENRMWRLVACSEDPRTFLSVYFFLKANTSHQLTMAPFRGRGGRGGRANHRGGRGSRGARGGARFGRIEIRGRNDAFQSARVVEDEE